MSRYIFIIITDFYYYFISTIAINLVLVKLNYKIFLLKQFTYANIVFFLTFKNWCLSFYEPWILTPVFPITCFMQFLKNIPGKFTIQKYTANNASLE